VEPPSQTNGYAGSSDAEDRHNTAEGQDAREPGRNDGIPGGGNTATARESNPETDRPATAIRDPPKGDPGLKKA